MALNADGSEFQLGGSLDKLYASAGPAPAVGQKGIQNWGASGFINGQAGANMAQGRGITSPSIAMGSSFNNASLSGYNGLPVSAPTAQAPPVATTPPPQAQSIFGNKAMSHTSNAMGTMGGATPQGFTPEMYQKMIMEWFSKQGGLK